MDVQIVAFPQEGMLSYPGGAELIEEALRLGTDQVGGIPHYEHTRELGVESVKESFRLAEKHDKPIDIHCDGFREGIGKAPAARAVGGKRRSGLSGQRGSP